MRVDKMIGNAGLDTRKNIKKNAKKGALVINGEIVKDSSVKVDPLVDEVFYMVHFVEYIENIYLILNKPAGVLSATQDPSKTVIDLLGDFYLNYDLSNIFSSIDDIDKTKKMYNPINYVNKDIPNTLIIHGKADELVPYESSVMLYDKCQKENAKSELILLDFSSHDFSGISKDDIISFSTGLLKFIILNSPL